MSFIKLAAAIVLIALGLQTFGQNQLLETEVSIVLENQSLSEAFKLIEEASGVSLSYNERDFDNSQKVTQTFKDEPLGNILENLLSAENLSYKVVGGTVVLYKDKSQGAKSSERHTISGYVWDESSNETLIGATIYCKELAIGTSTNIYGFYSLSIPAGSYELIFSYVGYAPQLKAVDLTSSIEFTAKLSKGNTLEEVVISDETPEQRHSETQMSSNKISMEKVKAIPSLMGERDVLKIVQLMPGVQSGSEGTTGLYVRGGGPDQNLMLLDGVPVYNASHLFGFMSTFNGDAIKSVELIKGGFPARYGGRLSSIIDVRMKEGNMKKIQGDVTLGLVSGRFNIEGPIITDKTSFSLSARRTWLDLITTPVQKISNRGVEPGDTKNLSVYNLYDINAKVNHKFSEKSRLYLSSYLGNDRLGFKTEETSYSEDGEMKWGNKLVTARWNYQLSPKLFSNTTAYMSLYDFDFGNESTDDFGSTNPVKNVYSSNSNIRDYALKTDFNYIPHPNHYIRSGVKYGILEFRPTTSFEEVTEGESSPVSTTNGGERVRSTELNFYLEDDMEISARVKMNLGVHMANFEVQNTNYFSIQPRAALRILISDKNSLKFSATKMTQFLHLLASPGLGLPTDLWVASTSKIKPENAWQYGVGFTQSLGSGSKGLELTVEGYYKEMDNLVSYQSGYNFFSNSKDWEDKVDVGTGKSYGGEILLEKTQGKTTGWIGYTLSKSTRTFPNINYGQQFPYKYDRRHDVGMAVTHKQNDKLDFGLIWVYGTGNTYTLGTTNYNALGIQTGGINIGQAFGTLGTTNHIESRNNQRMPAYHRLDLSVNLHKIKKHGRRTWSFGVYNAYARQNPFVVYNSTDRQGNIVLKQQSLLPILPYFSYNFQF